MLYVTHDQIEALTLGNRIAVMLDGRVQQVGTPDEIWNEPANRFVARFVGSPSMNLLSSGGPVGLERPSARMSESDPSTWSSAARACRPR